MAGKYPRVHSFKCAVRSIEIDLDLGSVPLRSAVLSFVWDDFLKKEVIHPQLPLRVPCYDFVPVIDPTFRRPTATFGCYRLP